ncbi:MAG: aldo/keto reductase [bacterium]|nr:aldo/keto reductase [bacterium]
MEIPVKKLKSGFGLPELGLGTWQVGGRYEADFSKDADEVVAIKAALEVGITHIDTAELYAGGHAEELIGKGIEGINRKSLFITSKVKEQTSKKRIIEACKDSLKRLGTKYLDLYLLHHYSPDCPLEESIAALDELVDLKLVKHIGVSNFTKEHLADAQKLTKHKIVCNQVYYNLQARESETTGLLDYCQKHDVMLVAYRPVEKGKLLEGIPQLMEDMCVKYQKTPAQIAINWLMAQKDVVTLVKTSNPAHLKENMGSVGWYLTEDDVELLRKNYPDQQSGHDLPLG